MSEAKQGEKPEGATWEDKLRRWSGLLADVRSEMEEAERAFEDEGDETGEELAARLVDICQCVEEAEGEVDKWLDEEDEK